MQRPHRNESSYVNRVLACTAMTLLLFVGIVKFWPREFGEPPELVYHPAGQELIAMEEIVPTRQQKKKPPPPRPRIPVVVDDAEVIEDIDFDIADNLLEIDDPSNDVESQDGDLVESTGAAARIDPRPVRVVEPEYTSEARRRNVRAEVVVEALVDERGRVKDVKIVERYLLGKKPEDKELVQVIGYGLEESAVDAAMKWMFRPARNNGQAVSSYYVFSLKVGV
ncbi:MAG: energy transducer TonB [Rhodothermales bacterium]|nr:energy transducer TonB [Rhodothermales bacterium]